MMEMDFTEIRVVSAKLSETEMLSSREKLFPEAKQFEKKKIKTVREKMRRCNAFSDI